jgi:hypothetical protein
MKDQFQGEKFVIKRSELGYKRQFTGDWRLASEKQIIDLMRFMIVASTYERYPKAAGSKFRWATRLDFAWSTPIEVVNDLWGDFPPAKAEPRELLLHGKWDKRFKYPYPVLRSAFPQIWRDAPTSLIVDFVRTIEFAQGFEKYPQPDISWRSHEARAYQMPVEVFDDHENEWFERKERDRALMSAKERRIHDAWTFKLLGQILEKRGNRPYNEWN